MTLRVEPLPFGEGQVECLRVEGERGPYTGFATRTRDVATGRWVMVYTNAPRRTFARLEGEIAGARSTWTSTTVEPGRGSRLVSERLGPDAWRRTQLVSQDGGATWQELFTDELAREAR